MEDNYERNVKKGSFGSFCDRPKGRELRQQECRPENGERRTEHGDGPPHTERDVCGPIALQIPRNIDFMITTITPRGGEEEEKNISYT